MFIVSVRRFSKKIISHPLFYQGLNNPVWVQNSCRQFLENGTEGGAVLQKYGVVHKAAGVVFHGFVTQGRHCTQ